MSGPNQMLNLTSVELLKEYLDFFIPPISSTATDNTNAGDGLSAGAVVGIVVSAVVIIIVLAIMLAVSIYFFRHPKHKSK